MLPPQRPVERRRERTRQVFQQAFVDIVQDKRFAAARIQNNTARAAWAHAKYNQHVKRFRVM
jgi:hypothetical protein